MNIHVGFTSQFMNYYVVFISKELLGDWAVFLFELEFEIHFSHRTHFLSKKTHFYAPLVPYWGLTIVHGWCPTCSKRWSGFLMTTIACTPIYCQVLCSLLQIAFDIWVRFFVTSETYAWKFVFTIFCIPMPFTRLVHHALFLWFKIYSEGRNLEQK